MNFEHLFKKLQYSKLRKTLLVSKFLTQPLVVFDIKEYSIFGFKINESLRIRFLSDTNGQFNTDNYSLLDPIKINPIILMIFSILMISLSIYFIEVITTLPNNNPPDSLKFLFNSLFQSSISLNPSLRNLNQWLIDILLDVCSYYNILK